MKPTHLRLTVCSVLLVALAGAVSAQTQPHADTPAVTAPPDSFFDLVDEKDREAAHQFYKKHVDVQGMPVVASAEVADAALQRTCTIVTHLLAGRPDVLEALIKDRMYLIVIGRDQVYTDMPEYRNHPNPEYQNERVRGTGGKPTSFGEENLLSLQMDRYDDESIAVHEFCHTIDGALRAIDSTWARRRNAVFKNATEKALWTGTYAGSNPGEFWAEICQSYFDCNRVNNWNHGPIGTREQLQIHDPESYDLVRATFALIPEQDWRYTWNQKLPNVAAPPARLKLDPHYTKFTWARELSILGRDATDESLLRTNDIVRKMFAYRHDILKALIANGLKVVVLGKGERLADLPELKASKQLKDSKSIDLLSRKLDYTSDLKLIVIGEENVLGTPADPKIGESWLIRALAKALGQVCGKRPVDPNWENRGWAVQQYELRVKRLDVQFGENLKLLFEAAMAKGLWKGTPAAHDPTEYWASGVVAYFDAAGQVAVPAGLVHPIITRELLKEYDPALWTLVHETLAYAGHVDWRLGR